MNCFACDSACTILATNNVYSSYTCPECGMYFQDQGLTPDEEQARYELHNNIPDAAYVSMFEKILLTIEPYIKGEVLDFGSGQYKVLEQLLNARYSVTSYDLFFHPVPLQTYDTIIAIEVVEHFKDPELEWKRLAQHVNPKGHLIVQTRFVEEPFFNWWYQRDPTHRVFYTQKGLVRLAQKLGLTVTFSNNHSIMVLTRGT
jgi:hypothetical protein